MDDASREYLFQRLETAVRGGFLDEPDVVEEIPEWVEDELGAADAALTRELVAEARRRFARQREEEAAWDSPTMNDRIDAAFAELDRAGVVALQNAGFTMSDGWQDVNEAAREHASRPRGACFYHGQDLERGVDGRGLMLAFGAYTDDDASHDAASVAIGREVCETLARHGVPTEWNGSVDSRIHVPPFEWRHRRSP